MKTYKENNGVIQLNKNTFSICELLKINIKEVANLARERGLTVVLNSTIPDIETLIEADEIQIRRVIGNLLNNAISYAIEKSNIEINLFKNNKNIVCQIKNKSLPIPEVLSEHLFDKYVCNTDKTGILGIGLGLYYCKKIIEGHNGSIKYYAEKEFSIFEFQLPCTMEIVEDVVL
jgi:K+-sensing histidine kinase KdpD